MKTLIRITELKKTFLSKVQKGRGTLTPTKAYYLMGH
jgi:hypothetical protein